MTGAATPAELRAAWAAMRHRAVFRHWPDDFDAVMADPVACRLVRLEATGHRVAAAHRSERPERRAASPPLPVAPPFYDHKRAAAGDRDD